MTCVTPSSTPSRCDADSPEAEPGRPSVLHDRTGTSTGRILIGFLKGSTQAQFTSATPRADGGLDYTSVLTIITPRGTLTLNDSGSSNPNGTFTEHGTVASGTGALSSASGELTFVGATRDQVHFAAAVLGVVCV